MSKRHEKHHRNDLSRKRVPYRYRAVNKLTWRPVTGILLAVDDNDLYRQLQQIDFELVRCKPLGRALSLREKFFPQRVPVREVIRLFIMLGRLTHAGLPILTAMDKLAANAPDPTLKNILFQIESDVGEGVALSEAMAHYPRLFPRTVINMIAAREETGDLPAAFDQCAEYLKWIDDLTRRTKKALRYPAFLLVLLLGLVALMMSWVVPSVVQFVTELGKEIPPLTSSLIATSHFFVEHTGTVIMTALAGFAVIMILRKLSGRFTYQVDKWLLRLPWFGPLIVNLNAVRFLQTFAVLYESGLTILESFNRGTYAVSNLAVRRAFRQALNEVMMGGNISEAFAGTGMLPDTTVEMLHVGEESGRFGEIASEVVLFYNADINDQIDKVIGMIEPLITILLALVVMWVVIGAFGPVYDSFAQIVF